MELFRSTYKCAEYRIRCIKIPLRTFDKEISYLKETVKKFYKYTKLKKDLKETNSEKNTSYYRKHK